MEYIIKLDVEDEVACIEAIAKENKLTATEYMTNICRGWIQNQLRGKYIQAAKVAELSELKLVLASIVEAA